MCYARIWSKSRGILPCENCDSLLPECDLLIFVHMLFISIFHLCHLDIRFEILNIYIIVQ